MADKLLLSVSYSPDLGHFNLSVYLPPNRVHHFLTDDGVISAASSEHIQAQDAMFFLQSLNTDRHSALYVMEKNMFEI